MEPKIKRVLNRMERKANAQSTTIGAIKVKKGYTFYVTIQSRDLSFLGIGPLHFCLCTKSTSNSDVPASLGNNC